MNIRNSMVCMILLAGLCIVPASAVGWGHFLKGFMQFSIKTRPRTAVTTAMGSWFSYYLMLNKNQRNQMGRITTDAFTNRLLQLKYICDGTGTAVHKVGEKIGKMAK